MTANAVNAWDRTVLAASESTFGTAVNLAASQALRMVSVAMGKSSQTGNVRPVKDRPSGRGMVSEYLEGDVGRSTSRSSTPSAGAQRSTLRRSTWRFSRPPA